MLSAAVFIQLVLLSLFGLVGTPARDIPAIAENQTAAVKKVIDQFFNAAKKRDWDAAAEFMAKDFELYTDGASVFNKEAYLKVLKEDDMEVTDIELRDLQINVSSDGQMAWARYRGLFKSKSNNQSSTIETAETLIFKREGEQWKMTRAQASLKPLNP